MYFGGFTIIVSEYLCNIINVSLYIFFLAFILKSRRAPWSGSLVCCFSVGRGDGVRKRRVCDDAHSRSGADEPRTRGDTVSPQRSAVPPGTGPELLLGGTADKAAVSWSAA